VQGESPEAVLWGTNSPMHPLKRHCFHENMHEAPDIWRACWEKGIIKRVFGIRVQDAPTWLYLTARAGYHVRKIGRLAPGRVACSGYGGCACAQSTYVNQNDDWFFVSQTSLFYTACKNCQMLRTNTKIISFVPKGNIFLIPKKISLTRSKSSKAWMTSFVLCLRHN